MQDQQERETDCVVSAVTFEQRLRRQLASTLRLQESSRRLWDKTQWLDASTRELEASTQAAKSESKELADEQRRQARMSKHHRLVVYGGKRASYR